MDELDAQIRMGWGDTPSREIPHDWATRPGPLHLPPDPYTRRRWKAPRVPYGSVRREALRAHEARMRVRHAGMRRGRPIKTPLTERLQSA